MTQPVEAVPAWRRFWRHGLPRIAVTVLVLGGLLLIWLLVIATANQQRWEPYYQQLLWINIAAAILLALVILWGVYRLVQRLHQGKFGSRLLIKLAIMVGLVGVLPGLFVYGISYQFVSRSIESWFDVKVEGALQSGLTLARTSLETQARDFGQLLSAEGQALSGLSNRAAILPLERLRTRVNAREISLWDSDGQLVASTGASRFELLTPGPPADLMRRLRGHDVVTQIEGLEDGETGAPRVLALARIDDRLLRISGDTRIIQATQALPSELVRNALAVQSANREYQERALGRQGLRRMYIGTLTLSLFLAIFGAVLLAVMLGKQLLHPLLLLASGVRQVAAGDLRPKLIAHSHDELGGLTRAFADMTRQLAEARSTADSSLQQLDAARDNLQTILDNLAAGVVVLDEHDCVHSANPSAARILDTDLKPGQHLLDVETLRRFASGVEREFQAFADARQEHDLDHWQQTFELFAESEGDKQQAVSLVARGAFLPGGQRLLVFDDISELVSAQRAKAWGEVARRLAHEIKNPLTPIQLSAERARRRLADKLEGKDQEILLKSVHTIVEQVDAMKYLVNEFRDYARLPAAQLRPLDLNALMQDVMHMYMDSADAPEQVPVEFEADPACPPILGDAKQLRQVIHNLVQNAQDATQARADEANGELVPGLHPVMVRTVWAPVTQRVRLSVSDHGHGFADAVLKRAFEPYVTTKTKGTGLGLALVKKIADEHGARVDLSNRLDEDGQIFGAQVSLSFVASAESTVH